MRVCFTKEELANKPKEELQETLDKLIDAGLVPPDTTLNNIEPYEPTKHSIKPFVYVTPNVWSCISRLVESKDFMELAMTLSSLAYVVDDETMEQIQQLVEKRKK